jgi:hypothetical protein
MKMMNKLRLNWKCRAAYSPVVGFYDGEEAIRPTTVAIKLKLKSGSECEINWHKLFINGKHVKFKFVKKFDKRKRSHNEHIVIEDIGCFFSRAKYIGYINGKRFFVASSEGLSEARLLFSCKGSIEKIYGKDSWQFMALLCWWLIYRD